MTKDQLAKILKENPKIDRTAIERSRQAAKQLADVGIELGGYRLEPALGGQPLGPSEQSVRTTTAATLLSPVAMRRAGCRFGPRQTRASRTFPVLRAVPT